MNGILGIKLENILIEHGYAHDKIYAELILDNRKIGEVINDGWCEICFVEFLKEKDENEFEDRMKRFYKQCNIDSKLYDHFIKELLIAAHKYKGIKNKKAELEQLSFLWF